MFTLNAKNAERFSRDVITAVRDAFGKKSPYYYEAIDINVINGLEAAANNGDEIEVLNLINRIFSKGLNEEQIEQHKEQVINVLRTTYGNNEPARGYDSTPLKQATDDDDSSEEYNPNNGLSTEGYDDAFRPTLCYDDNNNNNNNNNKIVPSALTTVISQSETKKSSVQLTDTDLTGTEGTPNTVISTSPFAFFTSKGSSSNNSTSSSNTPSPTLGSSGSE